MAPETNGLVATLERNANGARCKGRHPFVGTAWIYFGSLGEPRRAGRHSGDLILLGEGFKFDFAFYIADFWEHSPTETKNTYGYIGISIEA